jgi:glycosyltransferase involved in cell wall biosynthesis
MKILQLLQKPQLRGAEIFANQLSNHLVAAGHEVKLVYIFPSSVTLPFSGERIELNRPISKRLWDWAGWKQLAGIINQENPDIVQANAGDTLKFAVLSKLFFRWQSPIIFRNANKVSDFIDSLPKRLFNRFLVSRVKHVISVSELCRQDFINTYSFSPSKITTVPIGIECRLLTQELPDDLKLFFASGRILVHAGSFVPEKNHFGLLSIVHKLVKRGADVKVILIGDGKLRPAIQQKINELNLQSRVLLTGYRSDVLAIVRHSHVFVLPSFIEGLPAVILEAMYCKTPVVVYDVGGISEVIKNRETGWLVPKGDEEGFVRAVEEVLAGRLGSSVTDRAFNQVISEFDNRIIAKRFLRVYERVTMTPSLA